MAKICARCKEELSVDNPPARKQYEYYVMDGAVECDPSWSDALTELGVEGWRVISVVQLVGGDVRYTLERELDPVERLTEILLDEQESVP